MPRPLASRASLGGELGRQIWLLPLAQGRREGPGLSPSDLWAPHIPLGPTGHKTDEVLVPEDVRGVLVFRLTGTHNGGGPHLGSGPWKHSQ